jgi:hypothetical protein
VFGVESKKSCWPRQGPGLANADEAGDVARLFVDLAASG